MSKFKVGDRVRNIDSNSPNYRKIGVITSVSLFNYVKYDFGNYGQGYDCYYELYEETPKKIAVQCDTIEEWKAVLDKLFSEGKKWNGGSDEYEEQWFSHYSKICIDVSKDNIFYSPRDFYEPNGYSIIQAKEYLGKDVNEKPFPFSGVTLSLRTQSSPNWANYDWGTPIITTSTPVTSLLWEKYQEFQKSIDGYKEEQSNNKKPNKIKQMTELKNNIVDFAKNLSLSSEEKVLREVGLKDSDGDWNTEALDISLDLEAVSLGFKSAEEMSNFVPAGCELSKLEVARLLKKYEAQLLEIAKKMKEENSGGKKK